MLVHPNGKSRRIKRGFCWLGFLLPTLWAISEGLWRPFAFSLLGYYLYTRAFDFVNDLQIPALALLWPSYFVVMVIFGAFGKKWLVNDLLAHGYRDVPLEEKTNTLV
ncbi:hypothetical protein OIK44_23275 [Janthinobacterium sp. hw3]|uniref:Uncharacterized protein n=1 Tax=Janthinobacterium fluminis TaxID=2987524 RepID=A0ABT5K6I7_9BURK|nr:hypothetical protein [Janthinobacterium fluminis]